MEGSRRVVAWAAAVLSGCALMLGASGCGGDEPGSAEPGAVETKSPERTFAPVVELAADEPWRPMSVRWFIERSIFRFAEDQGCPDRKIAVGHAFPEQWTPEYDWIFARGLGGWRRVSYYRNPEDADCELDFDYVFFAEQLTRPHDLGVRVEGIRPGEGFYLDLADGARGGPAARVEPPVYWERTDEGDGGMRLTYWMLFGMYGRPGEPGAHEGDWARVDVLLRADGDRYEPQAVQSSGYANETAWSTTRRVGRTHPVVTAARATHVMTAARAGASCAGCRSLDTRKSLADASEQRWYGFGGAWGQVGATSDTTGPLGPHGFFPATEQEAREYVGDDF